MGIGAVSTKLGGGFFLNLADATKVGLGTYTNQHPLLVTRTVAVEVCFATFLALVVHRSLNKQKSATVKSGFAHRAVEAFDHLMRHDVGQVATRFPVWWALFHHTRPLAADTILTVIKRDGSSIMGRLAAYDFHGPQEERDIALQQPITVLREGNDAQPVNLDPQWLLVVIPASEITEIMITYAPRSP